MEKRNISLHLGNIFLPLDKNLFDGLHRRINVCNGWNFNCYNKL